MKSIYHSFSLPRRLQQGFTLVEIMISVTVGLILLAGVMQIFLGSKQTYNLQSGVSRLQENARFALDILAKNIAMAGYTTSPGTINAFTAANTLDNSTANATLGFTVANGTASDVIEINYESATDCLGNATGGTATDRYFINGTNLMCLGNGSVTAGLIAEGIENMQILYGQDTDDDGITNIYLNAGNVVAANPVTSVRIALLVNTVDTVGGSDAGVYVLLNARPVGPFGDALIRQVYTRTITLRNTATF